MRIYNSRKISIFFLFLLVVSFSCKKTEQLITADLPADISANFEISSNNSGMVTITPLSSGGTYYEISTGDTSTQVYKVLQGKTLTHKYSEGRFNVIIKAFNIVGDSSSATIPLNVTFKAPQNLQVTVTKDVANTLMVSVQATADFATGFKVYFGDKTPDTPFSLALAGTVSHIYANPGTYKIIVVALTGGSTTLADSNTMVTVVSNPVNLPILFSSSINYSNAITNFDGGNLTVAANPNPSGINTNTNVGRMIKGPGGQVWGGSTITLSNPIDFTNKNMFHLQVYSPKIGTSVLLKVENLTNNNISYEVIDTTTTANSWELLDFDFSSINKSQSYQKITIIFNNGQLGDGSSNFTFYLDNIYLDLYTPSAVSLALPINFQLNDTVYKYQDFDGGNSTIVNNPSATGINTSTKVAKLIKGPGGQPWGGTYLTLTNPINFTSKIFKMKVYSPKIGTKILFKLENLTMSTVNKEVNVVSTTANTWEEFTFDFSTIDLTGGKTYQKIVLIFDLGTAGDGTNTFTYYYDDIIQQ